MPGGALVISFDFEMAWGLRNSARDDARYRGVERVREVVAGLLDIFARHRISATWATIGHLMVRPEDCVDGRFPFDWPAPRFPWFDGGWFDGVPRVDEPRASAFYAPDLIQMLLDCPARQELGAHTFSHVMVGHPECSAATARAEFAACQRLAQRWGRKFESVVFPWNRAGHLRVLEETGYRCYRAINSEWYWLGMAERLGSRLGQSAFWRTARLATLPLRFIDEYSRLTPPLPPARRVGRLWEIPHSMFFPGFMGVAKYVSAEARIRRGIKGLRAASEKGRIFSLYTHPENFLPDPPPLLAAFEAICAEAARLRAAGRLRILTMGEAASLLDRGEVQSWCT